MTALAEFVLEEPLDLIVKESLAGEPSLDFQPNRRGSRPRLYGGYEKLLVRTALERVQEFSQTHVYIRNERQFHELVKSVAKQDAALVTFSVDGGNRVRGVHFAAVGVDASDLNLDQLASSAIASLIMTSASAAVCAIRQDLRPHQKYLELKIECVIPVLDFTTF